MEYVGPPRSGRSRAGCGAVGHLLSASSVTKQSPVKIIFGLLGELEGLLREMEEVVVVDLYLVVTLLHFHMIMVSNDLPRYAC